MNFGVVLARLIQKRYFYTFALLVFFTPLIFVTNTNELFEFPKMFFVYYFALFLGAGFFIDWLMKGFEIKKPSLVVLIYFLVFVLAVLFSTHLYTSVWGYYTRFNGGLVSIAAFFTIYFVAKNKLSLSEFEHLLLLSLLTVIPVGAYAILQHYGLWDFVWTANAVERAFSTIGQPNWLAQYFVMMLPIILHQAVFGEDRELFWSFVYLIGFSALWFTYSMSGMAGFTASIVAFLILFGLKKRFDKNTLIKFGVLMFLSLLIGILNLGIFGARLQDVYKDLKGAIKPAPIVYAADAEEPVPTPYKVSDPGFIRKGLWLGTWNLIKSSSKNLMIGTGPETYPYTFQPFRPKSLNYSSEWNYVFNKPHNYYLQMWAETGIFGLASFGILLYWLFTKLPKFMFPALVGFLVTNIFGWPVVSTSLVFWLWLAYSEFRAREVPEKLGKRKI